MNKEIVELNEIKAKISALENRINYIESKKSVDHDNTKERIYPFNILDFFNGQNQRTKSECGWFMLFTEKDNNDEISKYHFIWRDSIYIDESGNIKQLYKFIAKYDFSEINIERISDDEFIDQSRINIHIYEIMYFLMKFNKCDNLPVAITLSNFDENMRDEIKTSLFNSIDDPENSDYSIFMDCKKIGSDIFNDMLIMRYTLDSRISKDQLEVNE